MLNKLIAYDEAGLRYDPSIGWRTMSAGMLSLLIAEGSIRLGLSGSTVWQTFGYVDIGRMLDEAGIDQHDRILSIGPGSNAGHLTLAAALGASVVVCQPPLYEGKLVTWNQAGMLDKSLRLDRNLAIRHTTVDLIGDRIDTKTYSGYLDDVKTKMQPKSFTRLFIFGVLGDPNGGPYDKLLESLIPLLTPNAQVFISDVSEADQAAKTFENFCKKKAIPFEFIRNVWQSTGPISVYALGSDNPS